MTFLKGVNCHPAASIGANPPVHCRKSKTGDTHGFMSKFFREYPFFLRIRQEIEKLSARNIIDIKINAFLFKEWQSFLNKSIGNFATLKH